jgi:23S rRNA (cytidine2498-2'-O)-methyltransferase
MPNESLFYYASCQRGVEWALKNEVAQRWPQLHFAFSRPGFVTFKVDAGTDYGAWLIGSVFARTHGRSLGKVTGNDQQALAQAAWEVAGEEKFHHIHVWQRDKALPGERGFEPSSTAEMDELGRRLASCAGGRVDETIPINQVALAGQRVLDCVVVEPNEWWIGQHTVESTVQRWPGGVPKLTLPSEVISRAFLKTSEALLWSRLPASAGDHFVEIGCAPGGSSQALLERGYVVTGIDPAKVDPRVAVMPGFTHMQKRAQDVKRKEFAGFQWLTADLNVDPSHTLELVEAIVTHRTVHLRGLLLTLKMLSRGMYGEITNYIARVRSWDFEDVRVRQLAFNRQEVCLAALRKRAMRRERTSRNRA